MAQKKKDLSNLLLSVLNKHFDGLPLSELVTANRLFPPTARPDLQKALEQIFASDFAAKLYGCHRDYSFQTLTFTDFLVIDHHAVTMAPVQYDEIDVGEPQPRRCLRQALWTCRSGDIPFAVVLAVADGHRQEGISLDIAVPGSESAIELSHKFLEKLEKMVNESGSYRGKVISLEQGSRYSGQAGTVRVHKLRQVERDEVILPAKTLQLLERNVTDFIKQRKALHQLGMAVKKGLLFYGPPGTAKTHTLHYLANCLPDHTTLLITAGQVGLLEEYCLLARFLQPAMVIIEDADLIARDRNDMNSPCEESLLNKLLNEMDGLREDAEIIFVLTTNRPEQLESALASRPGRIDQAIEFPLPDADGRRKLIRLYARGLPLADELLETIIKRTEHASPAFIKELMRRSAQYYLQSGAGSQLQDENVKVALEDMLFSGGTLNLKLLGGDLAEAL
ncbi:MAG: 26S protease regulatory subunit [Candidatus Obscuribacter sp.]|nr:26S protease regulatory subunit [Candidatus Obscuribacter sp.]